MIKIISDKVEIKVIQVKNTKNLWLVGTIIKIK